MARYYIGSREANPSPAVAICQVLQKNKPRNHNLRQIERPLHTWHRYETSFKSTHQKWQERTKFFQDLGGCISKVDSFQDPWVPYIDSFQDPCKKSQKIKSQIHGPCEWGESSYLRSSDMAKSAGQVKEQPVKRSTTKRIKIQPHLCRARFNIHWKYQGSASIIPQ